MDHESAHGVALVQVVALLGAGVVAVPLFKRLGLGSVLGYLAAGLRMGPYGVGMVHDPNAVLHAAELGVVMFLFIVAGWAREAPESCASPIFGLGVAQVGCAAPLTGVGICSASVRTWRSSPASASSSRRRRS